MDLELVRRELGQNSDVHVREFSFGHTPISAAIIFVSGLADRNLIDQHLLKLLMQDHTGGDNQTPLSGNDSVPRAYVNNQILSIHDVIESRCVIELKRKVLTGYTALLIEGSATAE